MKRSDTIVLVLMGATTATAVGAYMLPSRNQCQTTPAAASSTATPAAATGQPCRSSSSSWGGRSLFWNSGSGASHTTTPGTSAALAPSSRPSAPGTSAPAPSSTTSRGGFGTTGFSFFKSSGS